jgi:sulfur carrier protein ThiS
VYYWNQKVDGFILSENKFIDNINTSKKETLTDLIIEVGIKTSEIFVKNNFKSFEYHKIKEFYYIIQKKLYFAY